MSLSRSEWLSLTLATIGLAVVIAVIVLGIAFVAFMYLGFSAEF